ncbi:unnamed protein product [Diamesa hyperborea]
MDTNSDDEKWEDFFGSSTDLTPSVIGYYDRLSNEFKEKDTKHILEQIKPRLIVSKIPLKPSSQIPRFSSKSNSLVLLNSSSGAVSKKLQIVSPNVQRMISSHQTTTETISSSQPSAKLFVNGLSQKSSTSIPNRNTTSNLHSRRILLKNNLSKSSGIFTAIPLSKNLSKISQSNSLLDSIEPIVHTITDNNCNKSENLADSDSEKTPTNSDNSGNKFIYNDLLNNNVTNTTSNVISSYSDDDDNIQNVLDKTSELINSLLYGSADAQKGRLYIQEAKIVNDCSKETDDIDEELNMKKSKENRHKYKSLNLDQSDNDEVYKDDATICETKSMDNVMDERSLHLQPTASPKLSYSRAKLLSNRQLPSPTQSPKLYMNRKIDKETVIVSTSDNILNAPSSTSSTPTSVSKHRPLSAASISSSSSTSSASTTSSSNSFGAEQLIGSKAIAGITYLASIESLADHSGNDGIEHISLTMCERAALEIIDSEKSYVEDLRQIIKGYLEDWQERACLRVDEMKVLFSNIQMIFEFNSSLLEQLNESQADPFRISKCFIENYERFHVYTTYCTSYPEAISLLTSLLQASHTNALLTTTQRMLKHTLPLGSFLLKPVQRILKYHLLLDNLKKHCDVPEVKEAHGKMKDVARNIDQVKRKLEQKNRVKELSGILDGWLGPDLSVLGELKQEGLLMENNKPRIVFLFDTMLIITKPKEDKRLQFKTYIPCKTLMLVEHLPGDPTSFHVLPFSDPRSQMKLTAKNRDQKRLWAHHIKQAMLEHFDIPTRAKELVFQLGEEDDRPSDKQSWKWNHTPATPEYLERRHQYRRSEIRYRSKKAKKNINTIKSASLERGRIKERRESFISYSREDLFDKDRIKKCGHEQSKCNCAAIKQELAETITKNNEAQSLRSKSESRMPQKSKTPAQSSQQRRNSELKDIENTDLCPVEVQRYNSKTLPKRIANLKNKKKQKETSTFYMDLPCNDDDIDDTVLKIIEKADQIEEPTPKETHFNEEFQESLSFPIKDAEIVSQLILQKQDFSKKITKPGLSRRTSFDKSITSFDTSNTTNDSSFSSIVSTPKAKEKTQRKESVSADNSPTDEPIYESLLRNVHVPYKFAPALLRRSLSTTSTPEKQDPEATTTNEIKKDETDDGPDCDYVTLTYSNEGLTEIDGQSIKSPSCSAIKLNELQMMSNSDTNINYCKKSSHLNLTSISPSSTVDLKTSVAADNTLTNSTNNLERRESLNSRSKSFIQKFMGMRNNDINISSTNDETTSQKSVSITSRKSFDSQLSFSFKRKTSKVETPPIYRQGSENLGNRIAHVDYADPKTLFQVPSTQSGTSCAAVNVLINKNSLKTQRDSVFSSSSDSVCDHQKNAQLLQTVDHFSNSYYEESVEDCLENDFRDSAIYSDDSNEKRYEMNMQPDEHIYATVAKRDSVVPMDLKPPPTPPQILRKPKLTLKVGKVQSPPIIPRKPSNLKSPEVRKVIENYRTHIANVTSPTKSDNSKSDERIKNLEDPMSTPSPSSWVLKQVQKFQ